MVASNVAPRATMASHGPVARRGAVRTLEVGPPVGGALLFPGVES